jgi:hypothetical protein
VIRREKRSKAARNRRLAQVGGTQIWQCTHWSGQLAGFIAQAILLAGVSWRWGLKGKRQVRLESRRETGIETVELSSRRRSGGHCVGHHAAVSELAGGLHPLHLMPPLKLTRLPPAPAPLLGSQS